MIPVHWTTLTVKIYVILWCTTLLLLVLVSMHSRSNNYSEVGGTQLARASPHAEILGSIWPRSQRPQTPGWSSHWQFLATQNQEYREMIMAMVRIQGGWRLVPLSKRKARRGAFLQQNLRSVVEFRLPRRIAEISRKVDSEVRLHEASFRATTAAH